MSDETEAKKNEKKTMTSLETVLHVLKFMSKRSKMIVQTQIPDIEQYHEKRAAYETMFKRCHGVAFLVCYLGEGIDDKKAGLMLSCFENKDDVTRFHQLVTENEGEWGEEHKAEKVVDRMVSNFAENEG